jgi:putative RecB family exonuclease
MQSRISRLQARNQTGRGTDMNPIYSHSRLSSFENCPRKFQYRYLWKVPAESESIEGFVGKRVHEVLERLYRAAGRGLVPSLPKVLWRYQETFDEAYDPARVRIVRTDNPLEFYREIGERCLANYYRTHYPFDREETLAVEERVSFALDPFKNYRMQGFIDRIALTRDGTVEIIDYKTSARVPSQKQIDKDRQLALYQLGLADRYAKERPVRLVWHYLRQGKTLTSTRTPEQLEDLGGETMALIDTIESERAFHPKPSPLCGWCEYRAGCPANPKRDEDHPIYSARPVRTDPATPRPGPGHRRRAPATAPGQLAFAFGASEAASSAS